MRGGAINNSQIIAVRNNVLTFKYKSHQKKPELSSGKATRLTMAVLLIFLVSITT
jgi:hypothetical protein